MEKELQQSIQLVRDGIQGIIKFLPSYLKEKKDVKGVSLAFRSNGFVPNDLASVLDIMDGIEKIEKNDFNYMIGNTLGEHYREYRESIAKELEDFEDSI